MPISCYREAVGAAPPPLLSVLRHALADPLSAAAAKAEVLAGRLRRDAPALAQRASDLGADLAEAGRLLDLLAALDAILEETPEPVRLSDLLASSGGQLAGDAPGAPLCVRRRAASQALLRVVSFGTARGGAPRVRAWAGPDRAAVVLSALGPCGGARVERLLLLPSEVPNADQLFLARAALEADGGSLSLASREDGLEATLSWPTAPERP